MSRKQFKAHVSSHEKKLSRKERREQMANAPRQEYIPTEEDNVQIKNLTLISVISILVVLAFMYWIFTKSL